MRDVEQLEPGGRLADLERQRQHLESLLEISPVAIVTTDLEATVTSWNPAAESLFGYHREEAVGRRIDDLIADRPDLRAEAAAFKAEAARTGRFEGITRRMRKDGTLVDVEVLAVSLGDDRQPSGYYAIYHDVSELHRQKQYYESLLETSPSAIMTVDRDGLLTSWNPAAERMLGYSRDEAIGRNIDDLVAKREDLRAEADEVSRQASQGGQVHLVTRRTRKDGSLIDVDVVASAIFVGGQPVGYYAIYSEVGELQRQKRYYESLFELSPTAIATIDRDDTVTSWNAAAERLFGYSREEAIGRNIDDLVANTEELRAEGVGLARQAARGEVHRVTRRVRKDGSLVDVDLRAAPIVVGGETVGMFCLYHDITELQRQRLHYASLVELSPTAIATVDRDDRVTSWNAAAEQLFGYTREEATGRNIDDLVASTDEVHAEATDVSRRAREGPVRLITRRTRKDGSLVDVEVRTAPLVVGGERIGLFALYHDISELQRQRRYYQSLLELSPTAVVTFDLGAKVTSWNAAAERLFGYTAEEAIGRDIDDLVAADERIRGEAIGISRLGQAGEQVQLATQRTRKDGSLVDVQLLGAPIVVGGENVGYYALYHDISELQQQRRYYQALVQSSPNAVVLMDREGTVSAWNPAAERLFGYSATEAIGRHIDDLVATDDSLRAEARTQTERGMGGEHIHAITKRTRKDGTLVDVEVFGAPVIVGGEAVGLYGLYHDIGDLQRAREEAEAATEAKSAFLATMSHEIRTPMNAVIGMTDLLLRTDLDSEQRSFAEVIRTSGEALLSVISDILDFSKIEAGRLDLDLHPFDLRECVESALELVARPAAEKGLDLAYLLAPGTPEAIVGDAARLRQVLLNLLNNAVKFTERGEVVVRVDAEPVAADPGVSASEPDRRHRVHFAVSDTGIGIPEDRMARLFGSFSQVDASTTRRYGGTGLGLAISKRLSELMGGTMSVESSPGEGSTFRFTIEAVAAPRPARPYEPSGAVPLSGRRILIVDDNATNRQILRSHAEAWGMLARDTGSPPEAVGWVERGDPFDAAILDMEMPEMDGVAVARAMRRARSAERLPLVLLTSLGRREDEDDSLFAARLTKPIRPSQLYDLLITVLAEPALAPSASEAGRRRPTEVVAAGSLRILVAEDNPVNRHLALLLLEKIGYRADVAVNGREAVAAVDRDGYDIVLMDVQMPEMDGLEATRRIHERQGSRRPYIIAATANATHDERERCLAAGMDDYLSKPIRLEELAAALRRALRGGVTRADEQSAPEASAPAEGLDSAVLERLRAALGEPGLRELIDTFLGQAPGLLSTLGNAAERRDPDELRRAAHTLKSNAATFGAAALAELSRELEAAAERGSLDGAGAVVARAIAEYERVRSLLGAERERLTS